MPTPTNLTFDHTNVDQTSYATASISPAADKLITAVFTLQRAGSTDPVVPTLSGCGLTWVSEEDNLWDTGGANRHRTVVFRAMGASPTSGALTLDCGGVTHTGAFWSVAEWTDTDTTGTNGSGAIGQSVPASGTGTTGTVTLVSPTSTSATFGVFAHEANELSTPGTGFTELSDSNHSAVVGGQVTEWRSDAVTTVDASWTTSAPWGGIGIEIKAPAAGGTDATVTPGVIAATVAVPAAGIAAGSTVAPAAIAAITSLPAAGPSAGSTVLPGVIAAPVSLPLATVTTDGNATVTPEVIAALASLPGATASISKTVTPSEIAVVATLPGATLSAGALVTPGVIAAVISAPQASPSASSLVTPDVIAVIASLPEVTLFTGVTVIRAEGAATYLIGVQGIGSTGSGIEGE